MTVLFVGQARHGPDGPGLEVPWSEIRRFNPNPGHGGLASKVPAAVLVASRKFGCTRSVLIADPGTQVNRRPELQAALARARQLFPQHAITLEVSGESPQASAQPHLEQLAEDTTSDAQRGEEPIARVPDPPLVDEAIPAPFDLPRPGKGVRVKARQGTIRLPDAAIFGQDRT
jgi:hypothetical protein